MNIGRRAVLQLSLVSAAVSLYNIVGSPKGQAYATQPVEEAGDAFLDAAAAQRNLVLSDLENKGQASGPQFVDGSRWLWQAIGTPDGGTVVKAADSGVWIRERVQGEWRLNWFGGYSSDPALTINHIVDLMAEGDTLYIPAGTYETKITILFWKPLTIQGEGARIVADHDGIAVDFYPDNGLMWVGDKYGNAKTFKGILPDIERKDGRGTSERSSIGVRVNNAYWPDLTFPSITRFAVGLLLTANRAVEAGRDLGTSYGTFRLGRFENLINVSTYIAPNPPSGKGPNNYVTECTCSGGSFSSGAYGGVVNAEHKHIVITGAQKDGMCNNLRFRDVSLEGWATVAVQVTDYAEGIVVTGRAEMPYLSYVLSAGSNTRNCEVSLTHWAHDAAALAKVIDNGRWNRLTANEYPFGYMEFFGGIWTIAGKQAGVTATRNWQPRQLEQEPVQEIVYSGQALPLKLDLSTYRRFRLVIASGSVPNGLAIFTNIPTFAFEVEITLAQAEDSANPVPAYFIGQQIKWGNPAPKPNNRAWGIDRYLIKFDGTSYYPVEQIIVQ